MPENDSPSMIPGMAAKMAEMLHAPAPQGRRIKDLGFAAWECGLDFEENWAKQFAWCH